MRWLTLAALVAALALGVVAALATVHTKWNLVFDDAFITYRYAKNLATGHGITWNLQERPTEGFTSLLHVLLLGPLLALRFEPLLATRVISVIAMLGTGALIVAFGVRQVRASLLVSLLLVAPLFASSAAYEIGLVGLETWLFAFLLLASWLLGESLLREPDQRRRAAFVGVSFVALLTRPEVLILFVIVTAARAAVALRGDRRQLRAIAEDVLAFGFLIALLQAWRWSHFRAWVPNPAYLKTAPSGLTSPRGVESITTFFETNWSLLLAGAVGAAVVVATPALRRFRVSVLTSWLFVLAYIAFYARVDTLMDISGRFLFPLVPVLVWQAAVAGSWWLANAPRLPQRALGAGLVFLGCSASRRSSPSGGPTPSVSCAKGPSGPSAR